MIIVRIIGGIGNQLFQYAAGAALAARLGVELRVDLQAFGKYRLRAYCLDRMGVVASSASATEIARLRRWKGSMLDRGLARVLGRGLPAPRSYFREPTFEFSPAFEALGDDTYLDGHWQSPRYFGAIEPKLRTDLRPPPPPGGAGAIESAIRQANAVSVHVRRGDYVHDPKARAVHETCPPEYYAAAVEAVRKKVRDPTFFVFSDEPEWTRENWLPKVPATFMPCQPSPADDLRLMSMCRHHIIANSTFSWWGAWLSEAPGKTVVAPRHWFRHSGRSTRDLLQPEWTVL